MLAEMYGAQYVTVGAWKQMTLQVPVAANANHVKVSFYAHEDGADFYIGDVTMTEEVPDALPNTDLNIAFNFVNGDNTWYFTTDSTAGTNDYYKMPILVDGVEQIANIQRYADGFRIWPNQFQGSVVPTQSLEIAAGTVMTSATETITVIEGLKVGYANGKWSVVVPNYDMAVSFKNVDSYNQWWLNADTSLATESYYNVKAIVDGAERNVKMKRTDTGFLIYPNFFATAPISSVIIPAGTVLTAIDPENHWNVIATAATFTVTEKLDVSCVNGVWDITVPNVDSTMTFNQVTADNGTWQFTIGHTPADKYYKFAAVVDGNACDIAVGESGGVMCVYPSFFFGNVPVNSFKIAAGTVMYPVNPKGWQKITGATTVTLTNDMVIKYADGKWIDMSGYADVNFAELTAADLDVYKYEDQAESQYRSTFAISSKVAIGNAGWTEFTKIAGKVLVDDVAVSAVFGMVPATDSSWSNESAFLLYITGEGYRDAATTASKITICKDTMLISPLDATRGFKFTEDFNMYKNCDGTWDTTPDTHVFDQQNTELEGALATNANCTIAAQYYYSCFCGKLGDKTFESGELGDHNYVNGTCQHCFGTAQEMTLSLQTVTPDTWQLVPSAAPENTYYKASVLVDGTEYDVLMQYGSNMMLIYDNFFTALGGKCPAESVVIPAGTALKPVDPNGWKEIDGATVLLVTEELRVENIYGKWYEMSKYAALTFTEIYAADLDLYYSNIVRLGDYSDWQIEIAKKQYPEYADMIDVYGRDANMTTFGIKSTSPTLQIHNHSSWPNFTVMGKITVNGAEPWETYVMQTPDSSDDAETAMDSAFLVRFYNGFVADQAASITIEPGTMIVTKDGSAGFVFVDGYTIYRGDDGTWSETAPEGTNPVQRWNLILGDDIGVKFQITTNEAVSFAVNGTAVEAVQNGNYYTINVAAAQMNDPITVYVGGVALEKTYTVRGYADVILADELYGEEAHALVKAMLVYGAAAQRYFGHNTGKPADDGITVTPVVPTGEATMAISGSVDGIRFYGASLVHRSKTAIRFYFAGSTADLTFKVGEDTYKADAKGDLSYIEVAGIDPHELGNAVTVVVSDGVDTLSVTYSALDYMIRMYNKGGEPIQALVQAMYGYYKAAVTYTA